MKRKTNNNKIKGIPKLKLQIQSININASTEDSINTKPRDSTQHLPSLPNQQRLKESNSNGLFYLTTNTKLDATSPSKPPLTERLVIKKRINNTHNKLSVVERQRKLFNQLYGMDDNYIAKCKQTRKAKGDLSLEDYQTRLLQLLASKNIDQDNYINISTKFQDLRRDTESISPLPPVNITKIVQYVKRQKKERNSKMIPLKEYLSNTYEKDEMEKEMDIKKVIYRPQIKKRKRNKAYNMLPSFLIEELEKKMKLHL